VVGVVADVHHWGLDVEPRPEQYYSSLQSPSWMVALTLRGVGDLAAIARSELRAIDPLLPLARVQTLEEIIGRSIATERSILLLLGAFAALALALTASGIWATMSYLMSQRRREIGIRLALGARENSLVRTAAGEAMRFAGVGIGVGLLLAAAAAKMTALTVYGVSLLDPAVYAGAAALVCLVAWVANYVPARRIARSVPLSILRLE
jgi:putative ABC transport system permease protein